MENKYDIDPNVKEAIEHIDIAIGCLSRLDISKLEERNKIFMVSMKDDVIKELELKRSRVRQVGRFFRHYKKETE